MRKLIVSELITLDGVFEGPAKTPFEPFERAGWTEPYFDQDLMAYMSQGISRGDALLLGRETYDGLYPSWTRQTGPIADFMNNAAKYVVSTTMKKAEWNNSVLINGNVAEEVRKLKQQPGKDIAILGAGALVRSLLELDLIDELSLLVYPVVLGCGKHFFGDGSKAALTLKESRAFGSGVVYLCYEPVRK